MPQPDPENVEKNEVFVPFDAIFQQSGELPLSVPTQSKKSEICITFFEENFAPFCFKKHSRMTQIESKNFNILACMQFVSFFNRFGVRFSAIVQQR